MPPLDAGGWVVAAAVVGTAFGVFGGWVASQKGRDVGEGVALGFVLGPFGVLIEALLPSHTGPDGRPRPRRREPINKRTARRPD